MVLEEKWPVTDPLFLQSSLQWKAQTQAKKHAELPNYFGIYRKTMDISAMKLLIKSEAIPILNSVTEY